MLDNLNLSELSTPDIVFLSILLTVVYLARQRFQKGLSKHPGPFVASLTKIPQAVDAHGRLAHII